MRKSSLERDSSLRERAMRVIPNGMYGHASTGMLPEGYPQFFERGRGCRIEDVDGNEYIDFMCGYGPNLLGMQHPKVEEAVSAQRAKGDCFNGPTQNLVELAEVMVALIESADWALFAKNGTDATTACMTIARSASRRAKILVAEHAYHGAAPWCTPSSAGLVPGDREDLIQYTYNDLHSVETAAAKAEGDLAGIIVSPFKHDAFRDQELVKTEFAAGVRRICDEHSAALILDDVRAGLRMHRGGSWDPIGVHPDLTAMSKAIANGHPLAAVLGSEAYRAATTRLYLTGSFWFGGVAMAAALATIEAHREEDALARMNRSGQRLRDGLEAQARSHGFGLRQTGPVTMPMVLFEDDDSFEKIRALAHESILRGVYLHSFHNMFICSAHTDEDIDEALERIDDAFTAVQRSFGSD